MFGVSSVVAKIGRCAVILLAFLVVTGDLPGGALAQSTLTQEEYDRLQGNGTGSPSSTDPNSDSGLGLDGQEQPGTTPPALGQPRPAQPYPGSGVAQPPAQPSSPEYPQTVRPGFPEDEQPQAELGQPLFGSQLFAQPSLLAKLQPTNADYIMDTGDRVALNMWGAFSFSGLQTVDGEGNIFVPEVGPVQLRGKPGSQLNAIVGSATQDVFTSSVSTYATLMTRQPISVFVTGGVRNPGRYAGESTGSLITFLAQAGGINSASGSYRDIRVMRGDAVIARADLYAFLLNGMLPPVRLEEGDAILVGPQGPTVSAAGDAENPYRFEIDTRSTVGRDLLYLARPKPNVAYVSITGTRSGEPFSAYLPFAAFLQTALHNGDTYTFLGDGVSRTIFVSVKGQSFGPSRMAVPRNARLGDVLKLIEVDPHNADVDSIYLRRKSVAEQQARALEASLNVLQRSVLTARSTTEGDAQIRGQEAVLVQQFIQQARTLRPEGRVVLADNPQRLETTLEPDDEIVIPARNNLILISGEVRLPQTVLFQPGAKIKDYAGKAGGFTNRADTSDFVVIHRSGAVETGSSIAVQAGDNIMVMPDAGTHSFVVFKEIVGILYQLAISTAATLNVSGF
ncbi:SLBB domain-containing protein [Dongia sp.]|uniref:polysaccharide biosynthesis/export family protein n=1 Tax=Dongia sp. TaxID=1977262 RepID=UPI0037526129